jgi:hypothetical protein
MGWLGMLPSLQQQKVFMYAKSFHWILSEFASFSEWAPMKKHWIHWSSEWGLVSELHIL